MMKEKLTQLWSARTVRSLVVSRQVVSQSLIARSPDRNGADVLVLIVEAVVRGPPNSVRKWQMRLRSVTSANGHKRVDTVGSPRCPVIRPVCIAELGVTALHLGEANSLSGKTPQAAFARDAHFRDPGSSQE